MKFILKKPFKCFCYSVFFFLLKLINILNLEKFLGKFLEDFLGNFMEEPGMGIFERIPQSIHRKLPSGNVEEFLKKI